MLWLLLPGNVVVTASEASIIGRDCRRDSAAYGRQVSRYIVHSFFYYILFTYARIAVMLIEVCGHVVILTPEHSRLSNNSVICFVS